MLLKIEVTNEQHTIIYSVYYITGANFVVIIEKKLQTTFEMSLLNIIIEPHN